MTTNMAIAIPIGMGNTIRNGWNPNAKSILDKSVPNIEVILPTEYLCLASALSLNDLSKSAFVKTALACAPVIIDR